VHISTRILMKTVTILWW